MHDRERWVTHREKRVLVHDYSGLSGEDFVRAVHQRVASLRASGLQNVLLLLDVTDSFVNKDTLAAFKQAGVDVQPYVKKIAVTGVSGVKKFFLHLVNQFSSAGAQPFETEEEALNWLTNNGEAP